MSKFHINKHGVPAPCRAQKGNCPYGGEDSHFDTQEEAQEYANKLHSEEFGVLGGVDNNEHTQKYTQSFEFSSQELSDMKGKYANVDYDGKSFSGEVIGTYYDGDGSHNNGVIIQGSDGTVKHIKAHRMHKLEIVGDDTETPQRDVISEARELINTIDTRIKKVREPKLSHGPGSVKSDYDLDTLIELHSQYVTTDEHDPVKNVQSMFDHVAGKSGKLYRYNDTDNPYLETHNYNFYEEIRNLEKYLEEEEYFDEYYGYGEEGRKDFERNVADHEELHDYTRSLAVEYGKDFEEKVVLSGKYSFEEQDEIQGEYRRALADKVRRFLAD